MTYFKEQGYILLSFLLVMSIAIPLLIIFVGWSVTTLRVVEQTQQREVAFHIAEAGIDYYRWRLAHDPQDFQDGTGEPGPYIHTVEDKNGNPIGEFSLEITPPSLGSTQVIIESTGRSFEDPNIARTVRVRLAVPSLASYAVAAHSALRFGEGTEVFGPIHSNGGIRFDGFAHNIVSSARETYSDTDGDACLTHSWGVYTCISPQDPAPFLEPPTRPDVFAAGRVFSAPQIDFAGIANDLSLLRSEAQSQGVYIGPSGQAGYRIALRTDGTFDLYRAQSLVSPHSSCSANQTGWGTWSIQNNVFVDNYQYPENGVIFVEDHVWVEGQLQGNHVTIAAGTFPETVETRKSITINNDILYTYYDGQDSLALIAQNNINVGMVSADNLRIDAALIAQNGRVGRFYYAPPGGSWWSPTPGCSPYHSRSEITLYGMIATYGRYGFAYTNNTGYTLRNIIFDANLLYNPPPLFPTTAEGYEILSWQELQ